MPKTRGVTSARFWRMFLWLLVVSACTHRAGAQTSLSPVNTAASLAQVASGRGWNTTLTLVNLSTVPVGAQLNFFDTAGNPLSLPFTFPQGTMSSTTSSALVGTINASGLLLIDTDGYVGQPVNVGWSLLNASGNVGGYAIFSNTLSNWEAAVPLETINAGSYLLAFDNTGQLSTGLALANLSTQAANVNVILRNDSGTEIGAEVISVPAQGQTSFMLNAVYPVTAGIRGTVEFDTPAGGQINVLGLRANGPALTTVPVLAQVGTGGGSLAHVTYNQGWQTAFTLVNTGTSSAQATLNFYDDYGSPLAMSVTFPQTGVVSDSATITQTLGPGASWIIQTNGYDAYKAVTGSAQLSTTGNVSGFAIFRYDPSQQEAIVPLETGATSAYTLAYDNTNGTVTGLALANATNLSANLSLIVRDDTGAQIAGGSLTLPGNGHTSMILSQGYPGTAGILGSVEIDVPAGNQVSALGLRFTSSQNITTIPVLAK